MAVRTAAGATIGISATAPTAFTKVGWEAATFTLIGEVTDLGEFGREYTKVEHKPLATRGTQKKKASFDDGAITLAVGLDSKDAGQILLKTAAGSDADYYFCITLQSGDKYFTPAIVMGFKTSVGSVDNIVSASITLELTGTGVFEDLLP
jgi:hypothetical protein